MLRDPLGTGGSAHAPRKGYAEAMPKLNDPVLPGKAASDYERYLRTDELLACRSPPAKWPTATNCSFRRFIRLPNSG